MSDSKQVSGGAVVVLIPYSLHHILLGKNLLARDPMWKFFAETAEPGEPIINAVVAAAREEAGIKLPVRWGEGGTIDKICDDTFVVTEIGSPERVEGRKPHWRHMYKVRMPDEILLAHSGKIMHSDEDEKIETKAFELLEPETMKGFLRQHLPLFEKFKYS